MVSRIPSWFKRDSDSRLQNDFTYVRYIGNGTFGTVVEAKGTEKISYAIKLLFSEEKASTNEFNLLRFIDHDNIVRVYDCWQEDTKTIHRNWKKNFKDCDSNVVIAIQLELCAGDLKQYIQERNELFYNSKSTIYHSNMSSNPGSLTMGLRYSELELLNNLMSLQDIAQGLKHIHNLGIIHRDLKPANILFKYITEDAKGNKLYHGCKIGDFGQSRSIETSMTPNNGTILYLAPEQGTRYYDARADIFAFGLVTLETIYPFQSKSERNFHFANIRNSVGYLPRSENIFYRLIVKTISQMVRMEPKDRPPLTKILRRFKEAEMEVKRFILIGSEVSRGEALDKLRNRLSEAIDMSSSESESVDKDALKRSDRRFNQKRRRASHNRFSAPNS